MYSTNRNHTRGTASGGGTRFASLLLLAFIILKLCHVINWSWWWVLSPFWITFGLWAVLVLLASSLKIARVIARDRRRKKLGRSKNV